METLVALLAFGCLVVAWAVLPIRQTHETTTDTMVERATKVDIEEKSGQLAAASAR